MEIVIYTTVATVCVYCVLYIFFCTSNKRYLAAAGTGALILINLFAAFYARL